MQGLSILFFPYTTAIVGEEIGVAIAFAALVGEFVEVLDVAVLGGVGGVKSKLIVILAAGCVDFAQN